MRDLVIALLGEYQPNTDDGVMLGGLASIDFVWLVGAVLFVVAFIGLILLCRTLLRALLNLR